MRYTPLIHNSSLFAGQTSMEIWWGRLFSWSKKPYKPWSNHSLIPNISKKIQKSRRCLAAFGSAGDLCRRSPSGLFARCAFKHGPSVRGNSGGSGFFLFKHGFFDIPLWFWRFHGYFLFSSLRSIVFKRLRATAGQGPMLR